MGQLLAQDAEPSSGSVPAGRLTFVTSRGMAMAAAKAIYVQEMAVQPCVVSAVRRSVEAQLVCWGHDALREPVALCTAELLTNVIKHAGSLMCVLTLEDMGQDGVRLTVADRSSSLPLMRKWDVTAESGRGMWLVASLADTYGWAATSCGKDVWAVFGIDAGAVT